MTTEDKRMIRIIQGCSNLEALAYACCQLNKDVEGSPRLYEPEVSETFLTQVRLLRDNTSDEPREVVESNVFRCTLAFTTGIEYALDKDLQITYDLIERALHGDHVTPVPPSS